MNPLPNAKDIWTRALLYIFKNPELEKSREPLVLTLLEESATNLILITTSESYNPNEKVRTISDNDALRAPNILFVEWILNLIIDTEILNEVKLENLFLDCLFT